MAEKEATKLDSASVNDFELGKTLGTGSFGRVRYVVLILIPFEG